MNTAWSLHFVATKSFVRQVTHFYRYSIGGLDHERVVIKEQVSLRLLGKFSFSAGDHLEPGVPLVHCRRELRKHLSIARHRGLSCGDLLRQFGLPDHDVLQNTAIDRDRQIGILRLIAGDSWRCSSRPQTSHRCPESKG